MPKDFNPSTYQGKSTIYRSIAKQQGICAIWDWDEGGHRYRQRECGNRYYAFKRVQVGSESKQVSRCFESFQEAKQWRMTSSVENPLGEGMTFKVAMEGYFNHSQSRLRESTLETYRKNAKHLEFLFEHYVNQIDAKLIDRWLFEIKRPEYLATQHDSRLSYEHELGLLGRVLRYYSEYIDETYHVPLKRRHSLDAIINHVRFKEARAAKQYKFIPRSDSEKFLEELLCESEKRPEKRLLYFLALFQLRTGARIGEACALDWKDFTASLDSVRISKTVQWSRKKGGVSTVSKLPKGGEFRDIPIIEQLAEALKIWKEEQGRSAGLVFSHDGFAPINYREIQHAYNLAFKRLGLPHRSTHILRHSFATDFLEKTGDQNALKKILGHSDMRQTEHYAKVTQAAAERSVRSYQSSFEGANNVVFLRPKLGNAGKK